jgi:hypothetical protein
LVVIDPTPIDGLRRRGQINAVVCSPKQHPLPNSLSERITLQVPKRHRTLDRYCCEGLRV